MKLKLDDAGSVVVKDGLPVYIMDDGKDQAFDAPGTLFKVKSLTEEKDRHFEKASKLQVKIDDSVKALKVFEGIDPVAAKAALETVEKLDGKKMIDAGEFDKLKDQMQGIQDTKLAEQASDYDKKIGDFEVQVGAQKNTIDNLMITSNFAKSPLFSGDKPKTILTPDMAVSAFGGNFKVEGDGLTPKLIGYLNGEKIPSTSNVGEPADFEEAIAVIIEKHPGKERFLTSPDGGGPGAGSNFSRDGRAVVISEEDAHNVVKYREAQAKAEKAGVPIQVGN